MTSKKATPAKNTAATKAIVPVSKKRSTVQGGQPTPNEIKRDAARNKTTSAKPSSPLAPKKSSPATVALKKAVNKAIAAGEPVLVNVPFCAVCNGPHGDIKHQYALQSSLSPVKAAPASAPKPAPTKTAPVKAAPVKSATKPAPTKTAPAPVHVLTLALEAAGFTFARSEASGKTYVAHGYTHPDKSAVLVTHRLGKPDASFRWMIKLPNATGAEGTTLDEFTAAWNRLTTPPAPVSAALSPAVEAQLNDGEVPHCERHKKFAKTCNDCFAIKTRANVAEPVGREYPQEEEIAEVEATLIAARTAPAPHILGAIKQLKTLTNGLYRLADLAGDSNFTARVQLLKRLRKTDKVLVKTAGVNQLIKEFYEALGVTDATLSTAARDAAFGKACKTALINAFKAEKEAREAEKERIAAGMRATLPERIVRDGKPILPGYKRPSKKEEARRSAETAERVAAAARAARLERDANPIAQPRPDAVVTITPEDITLLEDPNNGIVLLRLERPNSNGAICIYNNGSRVAAGVVPTEVLKTLRTVPGIQDHVAAANQLLHPLTPNVPVTPVAQRHLTSLLNYYKEIHMATTAAAPAVKGTKKFAAPTTAVKKGASVKTAAAAPVKAAAKSAEPKAPRTTGFAGKKIKVISKDMSALREGTKRYIGVDIVLKSKTTDEAIPALAAAGCDNSWFNFMTAQGYIELV